MQNDKNSGESKKKGIFEHLRDDYQFPQINQDFLKDK